MVEFFGLRIHINTSAFHSHSLWMWMDHTAFQATVKDSEVF